MPAVLSTSLPIMPPNPQQGGWQAYFSWMDDLVQKTSTVITGNRNLNYALGNHPEKLHLGNGLTSLRGQLERISKEPMTLTSLMDNGNNDHIENADFSETIVFNHDDIFPKLFGYFKDLIENNERLRIIELGSSVKEFYKSIGDSLWEEAKRYALAHDLWKLNRVVERLEQIPEPELLPEYKGLKTDWSSFNDRFRELIALLYPPNVINPEPGARGTELNQAAFEKYEIQIRSGINLLSRALQDLSSQEGIAAIERTDYQFGNAPYLVNAYREGADNTVNTEDIFPYLLRYLKELQQVVGEDSSGLIADLKKAYAKFATADQLTTGHSRFKLLEKN